MGVVRIYPNRLSGLGIIREERDSGGYFVSRPRSVPLPVRTVRSVPLPVRTVRSVPLPVIVDDQPPGGPVLVDDRPLTRVYSDQLSRLGIIREERDSGGGFVSRPGSIVRPVVVDDFPLSVTAAPVSRYVPPANVVEPYVSPTQPSVTDITQGGDAIEAGVPTFVEVAEAEANPVLKWGVIAIGAYIFYDSVVKTKSKPQRQRRQKR